MHGRVGDRHVTRYRAGATARATAVADNSAPPIGATARSGVRAYTGLVTDLTERATAARVPGLVAEPLGVVGRRQPVTVAPGSSIGECLRAIQRTGTGDSVFVTDADGRLVGVLTERDIFGRLVGEDVAGGVDLAAPVETYMTMDPRTLRLDQSVRDAIELMQSGRYRNVPVVDDERQLIGVVRQVDILKYLAESFPEELLNLPPRPHQRMEQAEGG
jgi:CBS domain-containing protein